MSANESPKLSAARSRLGRGLSSLMGTSATNSHDGTASSAASQVGNPQAVGTYLPTGTPAADASPSMVAIDQIIPNPYQPRRDFREDQLAELAQSIRQEGVLQPIIVSHQPARDPDRPYVLIAGERRLRAARKAGLSMIPCVLRDATDRQMLEWAMIENIQRADFNPIERAQGYRDYMDRFGLTQADVAERMGQPRATVANFLRLLDLCDEVQQLVLASQLSLGHAKILAALASPTQQARQVQLARQCVAEGLSVRRLEALVSETPAEPNSTADTAVAPGAPRVKPAYIVDLERQLTEALGTRVTILPGRQKNHGRLVIEYNSLDDFDRIADTLGLVGESVSQLPASLAPRTGRPDKTDSRSY